jgi:hypothetical protein
LQAVPSVDVVVDGSFAFRFGCCEGDGMFGFDDRSAPLYSNRPGRFLLPSVGAMFG